MTNHQHRLGEIIPADADVGRDALHLPVWPAIAAMPLSAACPVMIANPGTNLIKHAIGQPSIGIVDPFLPGPVLIGERCWVCCPPGSIDALRHEWTHPAIDGPRESREWMRRFADHVGDSFDTVMQGADEYVASYQPDAPAQWSYERPMLRAHKYEGVDVPSEFWEHYERLRGIKINPDARGHFFDCMGCS